MPVRKRRQKGLRVSNLALLLVVFKWHGSEWVNTAAEVRKAQGNESKGMSDTCCQVATEYIPNLHGNHIWCYKDFTNVCRIFKQKNPSEAGGEVSSPPKAFSVRTENLQTDIQTQYQHAPHLLLILSVCQDPHDFPLMWCKCYSQFRWLRRIASKW